MSNKSTILEQLRRITVALISLAIAITSLGYNTWRNEASEGNRNQRMVAIQMLVMLGNLQEVVLDATHGKADQTGARLREGWAITKTLHDISMVAEGQIPESAKQLFDVWSVRSECLRKDESAQKDIERAIDKVRADTHEVLRSLD